MKNLTKRLLIAGVLLWGTGVSCQRDDPTNQSCNNNTCCGQDNGQYDYVEYIRDAPVALLGTPDSDARFFALKDSLPSLNVLKDYSPKRQTSTVSVCYLSLAKVQNLAVTTTSLKRPIPYNYRVSGKVFQLSVTHTITGAPILLLYVDKITQIE